ncbi:hypothetical protein E2C01_046238 [Portunus trituberculatus]|uniref:Uncharacterized protein n=1 Tax=Portunus trituberculatus TaxID=210409 RepID=A0A5B7FXB2_PORTR|nr:hypothetical protein [Portunus trituberculatus]
MHQQATRPRAERARQLAGTEMDGLNTAAHPPCNTAIGSVQSQSLLLYPPAMAITSGPHFLSLNNTTSLHK